MIDGGKSVRIDEKARHNWLRGLVKSPDSIEERVEKISAFVRESNKIEGILRDPFPEEIEAHLNFMTLDKLIVDDLKAFVRVVAHHAELRVREGLNVRVGNYRPPVGGPDIGNRLALLLHACNDGLYTAYEAHVRYEELHPFTDGNGRSGRMLWLWMMRKAPGRALALGFLHTFYYQTLEARQ